MTFPDNLSLYALWDGSLGDTVSIKSVSLGSANAYGNKVQTYSAGTTANGRVKILRADEVHKEFGYMVPGDAIILLKLTATVALNDHIVFDGITYEVKGVISKKTHKEIAAKRVT